ncbi:hypothetical protein BLOT_004817 [Blomia tropicalis]|nr:hypothetical protein BLOT_004817 [Blomia tropicalis]
MNEFLLSLKLNEFQYSAISIYDERAGHLELHPYSHMYEAMGNEWKANGRQVVTLVVAIVVER